MFHELFRFVNLLFGACVNTRNRRRDQRLNPLEGDQADQPDNGEPEQLGHEIPRLFELYRQQRKGFHVATVGKGG